VGLVNLQSGHLMFCNAGHNPPVIGGGQHHGEFLEMLPNFPIGVLPGLQFQGEEIDSIKGRALFLYTDGLNEAENRQHQEFGDDRLLSVLRDTHFESAQQVVETLAAEVEKHRDGADPNDDLTMMCLRMQ
jgi:sigma-B regulation protein RsbU (phosphoserine phosphatase)